jgi:hypothetical protein
MYLLRIHRFWSEEEAQLRQDAETGDTITSRRAKTASKSTDRRRNLQKSFSTIQRNFLTRFMEALANSLNFHDLIIYPIF